MSDLEYAQMEDEAPPPPRTTNASTVNDATDTHARDAEPTPHKPNVDLQHQWMPRNELAAVRLVLAILFGILVVAALVTVAAVHRYRLVVGTLWSILLLAYVGLATLLQHLVQHDVVHPTVRRVARAIAKEVEDFRLDWRERVLLLTDGSAEAAAVATQDVGSAAPPPLSPRKPRSRIFRALVQPWVPLLQRRRRRRQRQSEGQV
jgi:hypothetical protein